MAAALITASLTGLPDPAEPPVSGESEFGGLSPNKR